MMLHFAPAEASKARVEGVLCLKGEFPILIYFYASNTNKCLLTFIDSWAKPIGCTHNTFVIILPGMGHSAIYLLGSLSWR